MFIAALLTIAKTWKQQKRPSTNEWIKKIWYVCTCMHYIYNGILLNMKKNEMLPCTAAWMDLEGIILSEISQRKTNTIWHHLHV